MWAELDVVDVKVAQHEDEDSYILFRMTWAQHKAYRDGRFRPRYVPGTSDDWALDEDGQTSLREGRPIRTCAGGRVARLGSVALEPEHWHPRDVAPGSGTWRSYA